MSVTDIDTDTEPPQQWSRFDFGRLVAGAILVVLGALWLLDVTGALHLRAGVILPTLLAAVGLALMAGSVRGPHPALVTIGVLLCVVTVFSALTPPEALRGGVGERNYTVGSASELQSQYQVGVGDLTLDLSDLDLAEPRQVSVSVGAGNLVVIVPAGMTVGVTASSGAGEIVVFGEQVSGLSVERTYRDEVAATGNGSIDLDLQVGAGKIEVRR